MSKEKKNNIEKKENVQEKVKTVKKSSYSKKKKAKKNSFCAVSSKGTSCKAWILKLPVTEYK